MPGPLPISVIVPTLNAMRDLPRHLEALQAWMEDAAEVIVVDGESEDGSLAYVRTTLRHPRGTFHVRPRGLYEAWNFAISQATEAYVYFATVGDVISPNGVRHLLDVAQAFDADVVISPPRLIDVERRPVTSEVWPIHRLLATGLSEPRCLEFLESLVLSAMFGVKGILGSSASNLYRTRVLRDRNFPVEAGRAGDTLWGCEHAMDLRIAVTPQTCAEFVFEPGGGMSQKQAAETARRFLGVAKERIEHRPPPGIDKTRLRVARLLVETRLHWLDSEDDLIRLREELTTLTDHLRQNNAQQKAYIDELEAHGVARLAIICTMESEVARLRTELAEARRPSIFRRMKRVAGEWKRRVRRLPS